MAERRTKAQKRRMPGLQVLQQAPALKSLEYSMN